MGMVFIIYLASCKLNVCQGGGSPGDVKGWVCQHIWTCASAPVLLIHYGMMGAHIPPSIMIEPSNSPKMP